LLRSLRAVLRKDSWMFCAGLFSIADLLGPDRLAQRNTAGALRP
jgi:hypothetical protein